jgi:hypothetical protein
MILCCSADCEKMCPTPVPDVVVVQELERLKQLPHHDRHLLCAHLSSVTRADTASQNLVLLSFSALQAAQIEAKMCSMLASACSTIGLLMPAIPIADHAH